MDVLIINWSGFGLIALFLWRAITTTKKDLKADMADLSRRMDRRFDKQDERIDRRFDKQDQTMNRRFDKQDERLDKLEKGQAELREGQAALVAGQAALTNGQAQIDRELLGIVRGLGEVTGELKRIAPREKVTAGGP